MCVFTEICLGESSETVDLKMFTGIINTTSYPSYQETGGTGWLRRVFKGGRRRKKKKRRVKKANYRLRTLLRRRQLWL